MGFFSRMTVLALALGATGQASAQGQLDTMRMSCAAAAEIVRRSGAVVLHSGPNIYDRYVSAQNFCAREEVMKPTWIPSADNPQCFIGYVCQRETWGAGPS